MIFTNMQEITSHKEMLDLLSEGRKNYVLLYKKGSESSDCSYSGVKKASQEISDINVLAADVNKVRDIHTNYGVTSAPTLLVFSGNDFVKTVKGCNDDGYYKSLFESALFTAKSAEGEVSQKRVTVYSTPTCTWCTTLKRHLDSNGIRYSEIDVSRDQKAAEDMVRRSGQQGVPQTDIGGEMIVGFDKTRINNLLGIGQN
jgi:glutaredoxin-like YruB-family protein